MPHQKFTVQKYASGAGTKEPFTAAFLGLTDLLNAAQFDAAKHAEIKAIIMEIYTDCLLPGFLALRKIHKPDADAGLADTYKNYDDLYRYLVGALKDRTQERAFLLIISETAVDGHFLDCLAGLFTFTLASCKSSHESPQRTETNLDPGWPKAIRFSNRCLIRR